MLSKNHNKQLSVALSEYAPGRLVVVNKKTYKVGGVSSDCLPTVYDRAAPMFTKALYVSHCAACNHVEEATAEEFEGKDESEASCPVCAAIVSTEMALTPEVFHPTNGRSISENDKDQEITYATYAQFPIPENETYGFTKCGSNLFTSHEIDCRLITLNKGVFSGETYSGFDVCEKCGKASIEPQSGIHRRSYHCERNFAVGRYERECDGEFQNVFLGHQFSTDLMLLRFVVSEPLINDVSNSGCTSSAHLHH